MREIYKFEDIKNEEKNGNSNAKMPIWWPTWVGHKICTNDQDVCSSNLPLHML